MPLTLFTALVIGIFSGGWAGVAPLLGLSIWAGFAGFTAYYAAGGGGIRTLGLTWATNLFGVLCGWTMGQLGDAVGIWQAPAIAVGVVVVVVILAGSLNWLSFIPGTFVGVYSYFAIDGDWRLLAASLVVGAVFGLVSDLASGEKAHLALSVGRRRRDREQKGV